MRRISILFVSLAACGSSSGGGDKPKHDHATAATEAYLDGVDTVSVHTDGVADMLSSADDQTGDERCDSFRGGFKILLGLRDDYAAVQPGPGVAACTGALGPSLGALEAVVVNGMEHGDCDGMDAFWKDHADEVEAKLCAVHDAVETCRDDAHAAEATTTVHSVGHLGDWCTKKK
jgi:hypothetical protein